MKMLSASLAAFLCQGAYAEWWNTDWHFRFMVEVGAGPAKRIDRPVELHLDFTGKFTEAGASSGVLDTNSIRVFEVDQTGRIGVGSAIQFDRDSLFDPLSHASGTLVWLLADTTPANKTRYFHVYFDDLRNGAKTPPSFAPSVQFEAAAGELWKFDTPGGHYIFEKRGGAFRAFCPSKCVDDQGGLDWQRGDYSVYQGILNVGDPDTHGIFHPNDDTEADDGEWGYVKSEVIHAGPVRYRLRSQNQFGNLGADKRSNTLYEIVHDIFPRTVRATMTRGNDKGFACIVELTPGGDNYESSDYIKRPSGLSGNWNGDISPEWTYIGDLDDPNKFYFLHAQDDNVNDASSVFPDFKMIMAGWARNADPGIRVYPSSFYFGFDKAATHAGMTDLINSLSDQVTTKVSAAESPTAITNRKWNRPGDMEMSVFQNPVDGKVIVILSSLHAGNNPEIVVYNLQGKIVLTLTPERTGTGKGEASVRAVWNGLDANRRPARSGVYFFQARSAGNSICRRMVIHGWRTP